MPPLITAVLPAPTILIIQTAVMHQQLMQRLITAVPLTLIALTTAWPMHQQWVLPQQMVAALQA